MMKLMSVLVVAAIAVGTLLPAQVTRIPVRPGESREATAAEVQVLMQAKLSHAQQILEGVVTQDFAAIEKAASGLTRISLTTPGDIEASDDPTDREVYEHFRLEFIRLAGQLERLAGEQQLEGTAYVQQNLTATCIACHDHMSRSR